LPGGSLNYGEAEFRRIRELSGGPFEVPEDIRRVLDGIGYMEDWRTSYRVQSVKASLHAPRITCIDSAILAYGLLELLFSGVKPDAAELDEDPLVRFLLKPSDPESIVKAAMELLAAAAKPN